MVCVFTWEQSFNFQGEKDIRKQKDSQTILVLGRQTSLPLDFLIVSSSLFLFFDFPSFSPSLSL